MKSGCAPYTVLSKFYAKSLTMLTTLFKFTIIKVKSRTKLNRLFYFTTINPRYRTTVTMMLLSIKYFFSLRNFSVSIKNVCATVICLSGSSVESYMFYYPNFQRYLGCNSYYSFLRKSNKVKGI